MKASEGAAELTRFPGDRRGAAHVALAVATTTSKLLSRGVFVALAARAMATTVPPAPKLRAIFSDLDGTIVDMMLEPGEHYLEVSDDAPSGSPAGFFFNNRTLASALHFKVSQSRGETQWPHIFSLTYRTTSVESQGGGEAVMLCELSYH